MATISTTLTRRYGVILVAAAALALAGCAGGGEQPTAVNTADGVDTDAFAIVVGDCLNDSGVGEVDTVPTIECEKPHESEVFASVQIPDGDFPDEATITAQANADCTANFATFTGIEAADSKYSIGYYFPTEESWAEGDREILCYLFDETGPITGSVEGSAE